MTSLTPKYTTHAWVDESILVRRGLYLLAAAVSTTEPAALDADRRRLQQLVRGTRGRLHWNQEEERDRMRIAELIDHLSSTQVVVTAARIDPRRQERARRKCMQRMLHTLVSGGVEQVWLESRDQIGNSRDLALVASLRTTGTLPSSVRIDHARPLEEPLLWIPDAVAGAIAASYEGDDRYRTAFEHKLKEIVFDL